MLMIRRILAYVRMRMIEVELADQQRHLAQVTDALARSNVELEIHEIRKSLTRARGSYQALFPPGRRFIWRSA